MDDLSVALSNSGIGGYLRDAFLVFFSFFEKTTYCCRARRLSVCPSVRLSVRLSVRPSVVCENNFFSR